MLPENRITTHPGHILLHEFLEPLGLSQAALARHLGIPVYRIGELIRARRSMTPEIAWLLAQALGTTPEFWMRLQAQHDLTANRPTRRVERLVA